MKTKYVKFPRRLSWPREVGGQGSGHGVSSPRLAWVAILLMTVLCLVSVKVARAGTTPETAAKTKVKGTEFSELSPDLLPAIQLRPLANSEQPASTNLEPGTTQTSPSEAPPSSPAVTNPDAGAKPDSIASGGIMDALDDKQKLAVGDTVIFQVLEDQEVAKSLTVTDAGELDVPELGLVRATGETCKQLAFEIKSKLERTTYYHATVRLGIQLLNKTNSGRRVYLAGEVRRPGPQDIPAGETWTVSRAIMASGGFTDYANKKQVRLDRAGAKGAPGKTFIVNISDVLEKGRTEKDFSIEPEDLIYVPARAINF